MNFIPAPARYAQFPYMIVDTDSSARASVARMKADGAICVKTFFERGFGATHDLSVPSLHTIQALVGAAHAARLPVLIHANGTEAQRFGLAAGVDIMAHGFVALERRTTSNHRESHTPRPSAGSARLGGAVRQADRVAELRELIVIEGHSASYQRFGEANLAAHRAIIDAARKGHRQKVRPLMRQHIEEAYAHVRKLDGAVQPRLILESELSAETLPAALRRP